MSKWKCEICGSEFDNFHAQGFDNKIYCPLCFHKSISANLQVENFKLEHKIEKQRKEYQETYKDVREELKNYKNQLEQKDKAIDECIEFVKSKIYEQKDDYYDYYEKGACFIDDDCDTLLEKLKQAKGGYNE